MRLRSAAGLCLLLLLAAVACIAVRPCAAQEPVADQPLFQGITYTRDLRTEPRPLAIHVLRVDLTAPGLRLFVTPEDEVRDGVLPARTTSGFLQEFGVQAAINANFFDYPERPSTFWDLFSRLGDPARVIGPAASQGTIYGGDPRYQGLYFGTDNRASFPIPPGPIYNAIAGDCLFLVMGQPGDCPAPHHVTPQPRTAAALDAPGSVLLLIVVDGRQPGYSEGVTLAELADIAAGYGAHTALNLDGGGSSALVVAGEGGRAVLLNSPIEDGLPGMERAVANHLGIYALPLEPGS